MPRARNRAPSPEPVEEEAQEMEMEGTQPLEFNEALTWRPGKQIPVTDLLRRLKTLFEELESISQEDADRETLVPKAQELANQQLIGHKDKGVKANALLCIVEMFRLLAPDAPYKGGQLKEIFTLFTSTIVPALASPSDPYNHQHNAALTSLTNVKSIVLLTDIPGSDTLILNLFTNCFDVMSGGGRNASGEKLPKNLEYHMTSMLCTLVDECVSLPSGVIDIILAQFLRADPNALSAGRKKGDINAPSVVLEVSPAYNMARAVCNTCAEKMTRAIGQYFSSVLIDASETVAGATVGKSRGKKRTHDESEDESDDGLLTPPAEEDLREVEKAHRLLRELWRSSPDVIRNVIPQMEAEIEAENAQLRTMAVQTVGDMIAGIGAAGPPATMPLDPAAYPPQSLDESSQRSGVRNVLLDPNAPHAFSSVYPNAYKAFVDRHRDKNAQVRAAWALEAGRIILTSGGGKGLDEDHEKILLNYLAALFVDSDERVRLASVQTIAQFDFHAIIQKIGKSGSVVASDSVLHHLVNRIKDPKPHVRNVATKFLGQLWGVAAGAIAEGSERVRELLGAIPSRLFEAAYVNDRELNALIQRVLFESLLPVSFPPIKPKQASNTESQRLNDSQALLDTTPDPDQIRADRILVLVRDLEERAKKVFLTLQERQGQLAKTVEGYLEACEEYNRSDAKLNEKETKKRLEKVIEFLARTSPDSTVASEHLKKFAKHHDRRSYQLIRFCYAPDSDYRKISKAMKELTKRTEEAPNNMSAVLGTLLPLIRSAAILVYNRSHIPAIIETSRTDEKGLGTAAHDVLKEISNHAPDIFKVHVLELCESLKKQTPSSGSPGDPTVVDTLKACAGFARRVPEGMPKDRDFYKAMVAFAINGAPPKAAKHAVTVIVSSAEKKEMYIKEIQKACIKNFKYGEPGFLSKLAAISQLRLLANKECEDQADAILDIAITQILSQVRTVANSADSEWSDEVDEDLSAKLWALRILVNGLRGFASAANSEDPEGEVRDIANQVYKLLNTLVAKEGELSNSSSTPKHHRPHLRLAAALQLLKLSCNRKLDHFLTQKDFNTLTQIAQDPIPDVRGGFGKTLKKHLASGALSNRFYSLVFIYAFEPNKEILQAITTWIKSRTAMSAKNKDGAIEASFARFLSLLAHHQDFSSDPGELDDFVEYIMFYLKNAATQENLPMIYHVAQRLKQVQDAIDPDKSENLYILSDIAEAAIRQFQELQGWSLQLFSGRVGLPSGLFQKLPSHSVAQEIADRRYIPDELADNLEDIVKNSMKTKKRKSDGSSTQAAKKPKPTTHGTTKKLPVRKPPKPAKTPKKKAEDAIPSSDRRKSARASNAQSYVEHDDTEDDEEMEQWQGDDEDEEEGLTSTPPTSDPTPAEAPPVSIVKKATARKDNAAVSKKSMPQKASKQPVTRGGRVTRAKKEKDVMDVPSDSD